ncbi:hypothetical protein FR483_n311R [Paramecium bursaria Chlorella virus FR483]|uniref:Uncharacterized protein n311R n=1 Tax=Paramecium bursaria Chlorella virus FR483 TaxID=399781 RepID=A7J715_PBCVF|nr:hypothetical protein FR483_n311R [Paramecium bursaria Chlorella virus FR483]ABT15596.1 hypothetical protein FR483_n311R [Paramecium bursaria Chlorella virus FR483]
MTLDIVDIVFAKSIEGSYEAVGICPPHGEVNPIVNVEFWNVRLLIDHIYTVASAPVNDAHMLFVILPHVLYDDGFWHGFLIDDIGEPSVRGLIDKVFIISIAHTLAHHLARQHRVVLSKEPPWLSDEFYVSVAEKVLNTVPHVFGNAC